MTNEQILLAIIDEAAGCLRNDMRVRALYELEHAREMLVKAEGATPQTAVEPTALHAEGSALMMELFNRMPVADLKRVPEDIAKRIGDFMVANGYRFVFDRWYLQAEPKEPERSTQNRGAPHE